MGKNESLSPSCDFLILISPRKEMRNERKGEKRRDKEMRKEEGGNENEEITGRR